MKLPNLENYVEQWQAVKKWQNLTFKVNFLGPLVHYLMETQNLVISFDYSWFLAKNLAYAECPIMKFHYRNSSSRQVDEFGSLLVAIYKFVVRMQ